LKKTFITNLALLLFLNLLVKPFWIFGIDRQVQNVVGAESYGFYFALFNFSLLLNILLDFGITNFNNRNISQNTQLLNKHFSNLIMLRVFLGLAYFVISIAAAALWGFQWGEIRFLLLLLVNQFLLSFILYLRSNIAGLHLFKTDSIVSVLDRLLMIAICSVLLWGNITDTKFQIEWFVYAQTVAYSITALVAFILVLAKSGKIKINFDRNFSLAILKQSLPFALLTLLMAFYNRIDSIMLKQLLPNGNYQSGIYAQAFRILDAASMFSLLFAGLLLPIFSKMIKEKEPTGQLAVLSFLLIAIPALILAGGCFFYRNEIMTLMYHNHANESAPIFALLMMGFVSISATYIFGTLLTANGSLKQLNIMAAAGMAINIILNIILIPRYEAFGAAVTSFTTQTITAVIQIVLAIKIFKFRINYKLLILLLIFATGVALAGKLSYNLPFSWYINISIMVAFSALLSLSIGLIKIKDIYKIIKHD